MVEIEIGERLFELLTAWIVPILYYEVRNRRNHKPQLRRLEERIKELESP